MFGLPGETIAVFVGVALFWLLYTTVFVWRTRHWRRQEDGNA